MAVLIVSASKKSCMRTSFLLHEERCRRVPTTRLSMRKFREGEALPNKSLVN